jgi:hypothetical protein
MRRRSRRISKTRARSFSRRRSSPSWPTGSRAECPGTTTASMATG